MNMVMRLAIADGLLAGFCRGFFIRTSTHLLLWQKLLTSTAKRGTFAIGIVEAVGKMHHAGRLRAVTYSQEVTYLMHRFGQRPA